MRGALMLKRQKGQGLVEFALIAPVLLLTILAIIETALIFQGYLTVQHAAREAARWAVTYKPEKGKEIDGSPCVLPSCNPNESDAQYWARRVHLIKDFALETAVGLRVNPQHTGLNTTAFDVNANKEGFFGVQVWGFPSFEEPPGGWRERDLADHPGLPGLPVRVRVVHNVELLDPLFQAIVPRVRVSGQAEMINEGTQAGYGNVAPPALPPPGSLPTQDVGAPIDATPGGGDETPTPGTPTITTTATVTLSPTPANTPTATPTGPFVVCEPSQVVPTAVILCDVVQHPFEFNPYELRWVDANLNLVAVISSTLQVDATGLKEDIRFTIPGDNNGIYFAETRKGDTLIDRSDPIQVIPPPPDLVVSAIGFPEEVPPNEEITITVEVQNRSAGSASGYFDIDLYVDPPAEPMTNRPGTSKQWLLGIDPFETRVVTHVVTLYGGGLHELWAQVDTSNWVPDELNETNNIFGPIAVTAAGSECAAPDGSILTDRFSDSELDPKWSSALIGDASVHNMTINAGEGTLSIESNGGGIWDSPDDGGTLLYQPVTGDFVATLKIVQGMAGPGEQPVERLAKIGLMARGGAAAGSPWVSVMKDRDGVQFGFRRGSSGRRFANDVAAGTPIWVRLVRSGDTFAGYYSTDGGSWVAGRGNGEDGGVTVEMGDTILIAIAATSHSGNSATAIVEDFEVCFLNAGSETCQGFSDDFEADSIITWSDADIGATAPGSSTKSGGTMTVQGNGGNLWASDNFHYTYQRVAGDFVTTLKINSAPGRDEWSKAGLMVRGSTAQDSAQVMVVKTRDFGLQFGYRANDGGSNDRFADETGSSPLPVWVRIIRSGDAFSALYSADGGNWTYAASTTAEMPEEVLIGLAVSSYAEGELGSGSFDDFLFCSGAAGGIVPPIIPPDDKPPGLKECVQTIELGNFEANQITPPWERNVDAFHASDHRHSGNFSLQFRASTGPRPAYEHLKPWAYQSVSVPGDVMDTTIGTLSYWQFVVPDPEGETPDPNDHFYLAIRDSSGVTQTADIPLAPGATDTPIFQQNVISVENHLTGNGFVDFAGQDVQLKFYGVHNGVAPGTSFYIDDVRFDICTIQPIPAPVPGTASVGGLIEVLLNARPTKMSGIQVWAFAPGGELYTTQTIHDSTYHFFNIPPGRYTIYAEVWMENILYTGTIEVEVVADERNYGVDLLLQ
jgi:regulation of enolase protein 1 (concanavalin A-like superfamily)